MNSAQFRTGPQRPAAAPTGESGRGAAPPHRRSIMRFLIDGADAFDVPETCLRKRASSLLTAVTACSSGEVRQLDPAAARLAGWGPGLGEAVERFFEDPDDFSLPPNVELAAFGGVADWLRLELDLGALAALAKRTSRNRRDFAWALRAKTFLRRREALGRGLSCMRQLMWAEPNSIYAFVFLRFTDDLYSVNEKSGSPFLAVGGGDREKFGSCEDNALWADDGSCREACDAILQRWGLCTNWERPHLELRGGCDEGRVFGDRWVLKVTVPQPAAPEVTTPVCAKRSVVA